MPGPIAEFEDVGRERFREAIAPLQQPAVLRGLVREWPAVRLGLESPQALAAYLGAKDSGAAVESLRTPPSARGRIFYNEALDGFNYVREKATIGSVLERLARYAAQLNPASIAVQSAPVAECLPGFLAEHANPLLDPGVAPRIWIGNHVVTPAHFDESSNIACVVAGRRRFTLLAPSQIANLYIGPLGYAPTGTPISLVDFAAPDAVRFPRFADAIAQAQVAELDPGDAIYIPPLWWHHVESLSKLNVLVNYWWNEGTAAPGRTDSALDALLLAILDLRHLPPAQRRAWGAIFEHYVFGPVEAAAQHIPAHRRGVLGEIPPELARQVREFLRAKLGGP